MRAGAVVRRSASEFFLQAMGSTKWTNTAEPVRDESFLVLLNAHHEPVPFRLPAMQQEGSWLPLLDTARERGIGSKEGQPGGVIYPLEARSMTVLVARGARQVR